jgi:MFS family permease
MLPSLGRSGILLFIAGIFVLLAPLIYYFADTPTARGGRSDALRPDISASSPVTAALPLRKPSKPSARRTIAFWLLSMGVGIIAGGGVVYVAHIVPFGLGRGLTLASASLMISIYCGAGVVGSLLAGWLADRIGPYWTLVACALGQVIVWTALLRMGDGSLFAAAALMGLFLVPITTLHPAALSVTYRPHEVSKAMGFSYSIKLPFLFGLTPLVALAFDTFKSYAAGFYMMSAITLVAAGLFMAAKLVARQVIVEEAVLE